MSDKQTLLDRLRELTMAKLAEELVSVQPMPDLPGLFDSGMSEDQLIAEGYEPVSNLRLLWIKKDKNDLQSPTKEE